MYIVFLENLENASRHWTNSRMNKLRDCHFNDKYLSMIL